MAYEKFKDGLDKLQDNEADNLKLSKLAEMYYDNAQGEAKWIISQHHFAKFNNFEKKRAFVLELCVEAINRDMIDFIIKGQRGNLGSQMYRILK